MLLRRREIFGTSLTALIIGILYRYWLVAPVLRYVSISQWRFIAIVVAAACGVVSALFGLRVLALTGGFIAGLLLGGTWAAWRAPSDVPVSVIAAFESHLKPFWRDVIVLTISATVVAFCCTRFAARRLPG